MPSFDVLVEVLVLVFLDFLDLGFEPVERLLIYHTCDSGRLERIISFWSISLDGN